MRDCSQGPAHVSRFHNDWLIDDAVIKDEEEMTVKSRDGGKLSREGATCTRTCGSVNTKEENGGKPQTEQRKGIMQQNGGGRLGGYKDRGESKK